MRLSSLQLFLLLSLKDCSGDNTTVASSRPPTTIPAIPNVPSTPPVMLSSKKRCYVCNSDTQDGCFDPAREGSGVSIKDCWLACGFAKVAIAKNEASEPQVFRFCGSSFDSSTLSREHGHLSVKTSLCLEDECNNEIVPSARTLNGGMLLHWAAYDVLISLLVICWLRNLI